MERYIDINTFDYPLPDERIAKFPLENRSDSKLLVYRNGDIHQSRFGSLAEELPSGSMLVFNNTKVIRARVIMHKPSGARIEVFCLEPHRPADYERAFAMRGESEWSCVVGNLKKWKEGEVAIDFELDGITHRLAAEIVERGTREHIVRFRWSAGCSFGQLLEILGRIPIPPYLNRNTEESDSADYQTVYSHIEGSVAAPTAGLHFSKHLLKRMEIKGIDSAFITLHAGLGHFRRVDVEDLSKHKMDSEQFEVTEQAAEAVNKAKREGHKVVAIGTTVMRTIETAVSTGGMIKAMDGWTNKFIFHPYEFTVANAMVSNFQLPESTQLMMVAAFGGYENVMNAYDIAKQEGYRFGTYGDAMLII